MAAARADQQRDKESGKPDRGRGRLVPSAMAAVMAGHPSTAEGTGLAADTRIGAARKSAAASDQRFQAAVSYSLRADQCAGEHGRHGDPRWVRGCARSTFPHHAGAAVRQVNVG
jgi:hypothetical protein